MFWTDLSLLLNKARNTLISSVTSFVFYLAFGPVSSQLSNSILSATSIVVAFNVATLLYIASVDLGGAIQPDELEALNRRKRQEARVKMVGREGFHFVKVSLALIAFCLLSQTSPALSPMYVFLSDLDITNRLDALQNAELFSNTLEVTLIHLPIYFLLVRMSLQLIYLLQVIRPLIQSKS